MYIFIHMRKVSISVARHILVLFLGIIYFFCCEVSASFRIVEVLPNTIDDKNLEYVTLQNISNTSQTLSGFILADLKKEYMFWSWVILNAWERRAFYRTETKLVLNNTNEEIFIYSNTWALIHEIEYQTSTKWYFLSFEIDDIIEDVSSIVSDESHISTIISEEVTVWEEIEEVTITPETRNLPEIQIDLQQPSYITQSGSTNIYICDNERDECKVNFDLRESFSDLLPEKNYICDIDFGIWEVTGQEWRCNPNTIVFPEWVFRVEIFIFDEDDSENFITKEIQIFNEFHDTESQDTASISQSTWLTGWSSTWENIPSIEDASISQDKRQVPEVNMSLQQPSYITQSWSTDTYLCDSEKDECRVNFDLRNSFIEEFSESDFICDIDFGIWELTGQEWRCNPGTVTFPEGVYTLSFFIFDEDDSENFMIREIQILNQKNNIEAQVVWSSGASSIGSSIDEEQENTIHIWFPEIEVQSGLTGNGRYFYCEKSECKINLNYAKKHTDERCFWDFAGHKQSSMTTHTRCNPWYVTIPEGSHELSLRVYEKDNDINRKKNTFYVYNIEETTEILSSQLTQISWEQEMNPKDTQIVSINIELQWRISQEKSLSGSLLECSWVERCYVNLEGIVEWGDKNLEYSWSLNGEVFAEKINPAWIWLEWEWIHKIVFQAWNKQEVFIVEISKDFILSSSETEEIQGEEDIKAKEKLRFTQNYLVLKYDGLRISGIAPLWSRLEIYHNEKLVISGDTDEQWKYRLVSKNFTPWDYSFDTKLILESGEEIHLTSTKTAEITSGQIALWYTTKKTSSSNTTGTANSQTKLPSLIVKDPTQNWNRPGQELSLWMKLFLGIIVCLSMIFGALHLIFTSPITPTLSIISLYQQRFLVKQKVCLIAMGKY